LPVISGRLTPPPSYEAACKNLLSGIHIKKALGISRSPHQPFARQSRLAGFRRPFPSNLTRPQTFRPQSEQPANGLLQVPSRARAQRPSGSVFRPPAQ